jgi:predicted metal-binding membrane protein
MLERALRRDRALVVLGLLLVVVVSWAHLLSGAGVMERMGDMLMPIGTGSWTPGHAALIVSMWAVMMVAMMLPGAAPMILFYSAIARRRSEREPAAAAGGVFSLGYLAVWAIFSLAAAALQFGLERTALLSPAMKTTSIAVAGIVLIAAGVYQWTPLKHACLRRCRSPLEFVMLHWRAGARGAFTMGFRHGGYCVGCCWLLMLLLFIGGVMNVAWIAGISLFILVEKTAPAGRWISRGAGAILAAWGLATLLAQV